MRTINEIIVHCSATKEGKSFSVQDINRWHIREGYNGIGYHYVVYLDGTIAKGRSIDKVGAHTKGHNAESIGICYIGGLDGENKPKDTRTKAQKESLKQLIGDLCAEYPTINKISGHRQYAAKACPCFDAEKEYKKYVQIDED